MAELEREIENERVEPIYAEPVVDTTPPPASQTANDRAALLEEIRRQRAAETVTTTPPPVTTTAPPVSTGSTIMGGTVTPPPPQRSEIIGSTRTYDDTVSRTTYDTTVRNSGSMGMTPAMPGFGTSALPANASAGTCYARVYVPPQYDRLERRVLTKEASERISVTQPRYTSRTERYVVQEAGEMLEILDENGRPFRANERPDIRTRGDGTIEVIPRAFDTVQDQIMVREGADRLEVMPAQYETITERVMIRPARQVWKPQRSQIYGAAIVTDSNGEMVTRIDESGEVICLVEEPAEYKTITRQVLRRPAQTRRIPLDAEYRTITKRIPRRMSVRTVPTEPQYQTVTQQVLAEAATERRTPLQEEYQTYYEEQLIADAEVGWLPVLCDVNVTRETLREVQRALQRNGYEPGAVDGVLGTRTLRALTSFQRANGLAWGALTLETLDALGVYIDM
ncbi:MAG: hypothetical protein RhofKO_41850 [Rhodothermales bacterium]